MNRAFGSQIVGFLKHNGLKSVVTKQKQAYASAVILMKLLLIEDSYYLI